MQKVEGNDRMGKPRDLFKKIGDTKGNFHSKMESIKDRNGMDLTEQKILRRGGKNTRKNCTKKIFTTRIIMMMWSLIRARHLRMWSQVGLRKHHYKQSYWRWWCSSWAVLNPERWCCESATLNMPANLEKSSVATGLEKVRFHSNPKERQCERMLKLLHNCTHLTY